MHVGARHQRWEPKLVGRDHQRRVSGVLSADVWREMKGFFKSIYFKILIIVFILSLVVIHLLFKIDSGVSLLQAEWSAGEVLAYVASFMATVGTMALAYASFRSSERSQEIANKLSEENNALQKVLAQNLYPTVNIRDIVVNKANAEYYSSELGYNSINGKTHSFVTGYTYNDSCGSIKIYVNLDLSDSSKQLSIKTMKFNIENSSRVMIRHIAFHGLTVRGYNKIFEAVECENINGCDSGESILLSPGQRISAKLKIFYCDRIFEKAWEDPAGGLSIIIDVTNTSVTGVKFDQYIIVEGTNTGLSRVFLGDRDK